MPNRFCSCGAIHNGRTIRCPACQARHEAARGTTTQRGYGTEHQRLGAQLRAELTQNPGRPCRRCRKPMWPDQQLDLGHPTDGYQGRDLEHAECNRGKVTQRDTAEPTKIF